MNRFFLWIVCSLLIVTGPTPRLPQMDPNHDQWLQERYFEATSIKEGMTRADLLKVFRMDGGIQLLLPTRYVLKDSNFIKVDIEFDVPAGQRIVPDDSRFEMRDSSENFQFVSNEKLKIKRISKPYIEPFAND
ncbi:MAG TPA: hypothetical protein VIG25_25950 [Pyrinomonadaceae bacterium]